MNQFSVAWFCKWKSLRKLTIVTNIKTPSTLKICVLDSYEKVISTDYSLKALRESLSLALIISQSFRILFILSSPLFALVVDHVISVHVTESSEYCELKCYLEDDCMSINIEPKGDGTYYYELSDQTMLYILEIWKIGKTLSTDQCRWEFVDSTNGSICLSILLRRGIHSD